MKKLLLVVSLLVVGFSIQAAVLFSRSHDGSGTLIPSTWYSPDGLDSDQYAYDTFTVASNGVLAEVEWFGGAGGGNLNFQLTFFDPIHPVSNPQIAAPTLANFNTGTAFTQTLIGTFGGSPIYSFRYVLPTPVALASGTTYTLLIVDNSGSWAGIARGGSGTHLQFYTGLAMFLNSPGDTAFNLYSSDNNYSVTTTVTPAEAGATGGDGIYPSNTTATVTATPNTGYVFKRWLVNGTQVSTKATYSFQVTSNRTLTAVFTNAITIAAAAAPAEGGTVSGGGAFSANTAVKLTASPAPGYDFINWTEGNQIVGTATNLNLTANTNRSLVAHFAISPQAAFIDFDHSTPAPGAYRFFYNVSEWEQSDRGFSAYFLPELNDWMTRTNIFTPSPWQPSVFSGVFFAPPNFTAAVGKVRVRFSEPVTRASFNFVTAALHSVADVPTSLLVTAYTNAPTGPAVASVTGAGVFKDVNFYPEGLIELNSAVPFDYITIESTAYSIPFYFDNLVVRRLPPADLSVAVEAEPVFAGTVQGGGNFGTGATVNVSAQPASGFRFVNWTDAGLIVSTTSNYNFTAQNSRTLVANFEVIPQPPVANGGTFYRLPNQSLAINILDLLWNDHDVLGNAVSLIAVSVTTNHLTLMTNETQIIVPAGAGRDAFSYTVADSAGLTAVGMVQVEPIASAAATGLELDLNSIPGQAIAVFSGVPWYPYEAQRATNAAFTGTLQVWPTQADPDGQIWIWDDFADLPAQPAAAFYRLRYQP